MKIKVITIKIITSVKPVSKNIKKKVTKGFIECNDDYIKKILKNKI